MATVRHLGLLPRSACYIQTDEPPPYLNSVAAPSSGWVWPSLSIQESTAAIWRVAQWGCSRPIGEFTPSQDLTTILDSEKDLVCANTYFGVFGSESVDDELLSYTLRTGGWTSFKKFFHGGSYYSIAILVTRSGNTATSVQNNGNLHFTVTLDGFSTDFFPIKYWPYDPGDGLGPIYNSATGAQLRAFPS
jgi:hypothetical protein